jgi:hypothetical protein
MRAHAEKIRARYQIDPDNLALRQATLRGPMMLLAHSQAAHSVAQRLMTLLDRQREERAALLAGSDGPRGSYADRVADLTMTFPDGSAVSTAGTRFDEIVGRYEACHRATTEQLRQVLLDDSPTPTSDDEAMLIAAMSDPSGQLALAANLVARVLRRHALCVDVRPDQPDWQTTVLVLEYHGWDCGRGSLRHKADRLRKLVSRRTAGAF